MRKRMSLADLLRASWLDVPANQPEGNLVECLSDDAMRMATLLALDGFGTITFTANQRGRRFLEVMENAS